MKRYVVLVILFSCSACVTEQPVYQRNLEGMELELSSLSRQIKASIGYPRCDSFTDCDALATGYAPCGGPNQFQVYSKKLATESNLRGLALRRVRLEREYISAANLSGVCEIEMKPQLTCRAGLCVKIER